MPRLRMRAASVSSIIALSLTAMPSFAQETIDEGVAIQRALAREGVAARDDAERSAAEAEVGVIGPLENPSAEVSYEGGGGESEWQLGIVQPIDLNGQRGALRDAARAEAAAVDADVNRRRQLLVAEVRSAFVECAAGSAELDIWQRYADELAEAERVSSARAEAGDTAVYDVRRVRVEQRSADAQLAVARGEKAAQCAALAALTGINAPQVELEALTRLTSASTPAERPDIRAREQRIIAAEQRVSAARRSRLPQIVVGAGVRRIDDGIDTAYGPALSLGITLPIWNGGGAAVRRDEARQAVLESDLLIARRQAEAELASAAARRSATREAAVMSARAREDAGRLGTIADTAYQSGEIGVVELLDAYEAARDADLSVIAFALEAALAAIEYDLTTGRNY